MSSIALITQDELDIVNQAKAIIGKSMQRGNKLCSPNEVTDYFILHLGLLEYEMFGVLYLNNQNRVICFEELFRGTVNETSVYPREIAKQTLFYNAVSIILVHNHPSGESSSSTADIQLTRKIEQVLALIDVKVLDHFIIAKDRAVSMKERGDIWFFPRNIIFFLVLIVNEYF